MCLVIVIFLLGIVLGGLIAIGYSNISSPQTLHATQVTRLESSPVVRSPSTTAIASKPAMEAILERAAAVSTSSAVAGHEQEDEIFRQASQLIKSKGTGSVTAVLDFFIGNQTKCQPVAECGTYDLRFGRVGQPATWTIAKSADFNTPHYKNISAKLGMKPWMHRKYWEVCLPQSHDHTHS